MPLKQLTPPHHEVEERYQIELEFTPEELSDIVRMTPEGEMVPDRIVLVWTRQNRHIWVRRTAGRYGSRAEGYVKGPGGWGKYGPRLTREIFGRGLGNMNRWAEFLPGLRTAIEDIESELPD